MTAVTGNMQHPARMTAHHMKIRVCPGILVISLS
jgi:hypothetical protein